VSVNCLHPAAQLVSAALATGIVITLILGALRARWRSALLFAASLAGLTLITLWLGSYAYSPLMNYAAGAPSLLGLEVTKSARSSEVLPSGSAITIAAGSPTSISALTVPSQARCFWTSRGGAIMDGVDTCDLIYLPQTGALSDILQVHVFPSCGLPAASGKLQIEILP
jgi:hypothetical protein